LVSANQGQASFGLTVGLRDWSYLPSNPISINLSVRQMPLAPLERVAGLDYPISGNLVADVAVHGSQLNPTGSGSVKLLNAKADLNLANHRADATLSSGIAQASVQARVSTNLTGDYYTVASVDTTVLPVAALLAVYVPTLPEGLQGQMELHASAKGPLKDKSRMEAHLVIPKLNAEYQSLQIANTVPIRVNYAKSVV